MAKKCLIITREGNWSSMKRMNNDSKDTCFRLSELLLNKRPDFVYT